MKTRIILLGILTYFFSAGTALAENTGLTIKLFLQNGEQIYLYLTPEKNQETEHSFDLKMVIQQVKDQKPGTSNFDIKPFIKPEKDVAEDDIDINNIFQETNESKKAK